MLLRWITDVGPLAYSCRLLTVTVPTGLPAMLNVATWGGLIQRNNGYPLAHSHCR